MTCSTVASCEWMGVGVAGSHIDYFAQVQEQVFSAYHSAVTEGEINQYPTLF